MITNNPTHLNCPWCPAQAYPKGSVGSYLGIQEYRCPANHLFYIEAYDASFNFGHNQEAA